MKVKFFAAGLAIALSSRMALSQTTVTTTGAAPGAPDGNFVLFSGSPTNIEQSSYLSEGYGILMVHAPLQTDDGQDIRSGGEVQSKTGFRVFWDGHDDDAYGAPWYGVGQSALHLYNNAIPSAVQVAGYFGIDFETGAGTVVVRGDSGNVGIDTDTPQAKLEVNGSIMLTSTSGGFVTFADSTVQSTAWNGTTLGGDYAESIDVLGDRSTYEPGDVIVIDDSESGKFVKSSEAYSKLVAGVYSTKPGLLGRRTTFARENMTAEVPMAMMGIVPTKVSTENGEIRRGDLLVSSSTRGYAMKATEPGRMTGAVIGKALAPLKSGSGLIEVLVSLQ